MLLLRIQIICLKYFQAIALLVFVLALILSTNMSVLKERRILFSYSLCLLIIYLTSVDFVYVQLRRDSWQTKEDSLQRTLFFSETSHLSRQIFMDGNSLRRSGKSHRSE